MVNERALLESRPARMPLARQKGQRTSGEPRAVHESVVPEASIGAPAKNSRARLRSERKERKEERSGKDREKCRLKIEVQRDPWWYSERRTRHERVTIAWPASQPASQRELAIDATRRAADFTQHSPFKSPSGGGGGLNRRASSIGRLSSLR